MGEATSGEEVGEELILGSPETKAGGSTIEGKDPWVKTGEVVSDGLEEGRSVDSVKGVFAVDFEVEPLGVGAEDFTNGVSEDLNASREGDSKLDRGVTGGGRGGIEEVGEKGVVLFAGGARDEASND